MEKGLPVCGMKEVTDSVAAACSDVQSGLGHFRSGSGLMNWPEPDFFSKTHHRDGNHCPQCSPFST